MPLGRLDLKGVAGPTRAFAALRAGSQESRFEGHCHINRFYCSLLASTLNSDSINSMT